MPDIPFLRIDKYLWAVRICKTRTQAADACLHGRVSIGGRSAKPSAQVRQGDTIEVRKSPVQYRYRVLAMPPSRVGAGLAANFVQDITPQEELGKLAAAGMAAFGQRGRGEGRPTKRDRRRLEAFCNYVP